MATDEYAGYYVERSEEEWWELARQKAKETEDYYGELSSKYWNDTDAAVWKAVYYDNQYKSESAAYDEREKALDEEGYKASHKNGMVQEYGEDWDSYQSQKSSLSQERSATTSKSRSAADENYEKWKQEYAYSEAKAAKEAADEAAEQKKRDDAKTNAAREQDFWRNRRNSKSDGSGSGGAMGSGDTRDAGDMRSLLGIYAETTDRSQSGLGI